MKEKSDSKHNLFSELPAIDRLLQHPVITDLCANNPEEYVHNCVRKTVEEVREALVEKLITKVAEMPDSDALVSRVVDLVKTGLGKKLIRAINGAGVILHTGLGRAPLAPSAQEAAYP